MSIRNNFDYLSLAINDIQTTTRGVEIQKLFEKGVLKAVSIIRPFERPSDEGA